jgi:hypothetical protein
VKLFLSNRHNFIDFLLTEHLLGMLPACWKNNRLEKSVVQVYTKKKFYLGIYLKIEIQSILIRKDRFFDEILEFLM